MTAFNEHPGVRVQWVSTRWTKLSRGGAEASRRNACPVAFPWPHGSATWHVVVMWEHSAFEPEHEFGEGDLPSQVLDELSLRLDGDRLSVRPKVSPFFMPQRHRRPPAQRIGPGEWVRWSINHRIGLDQGWRYGLDTFSIGYEVAGRDTFLGEPTLTVSELEALR